MSRTSQSIKNIVAGIGSQIFLALVSFFTTRLIKVNLGFEYLGLNGVFNNIMALLGLPEKGIGTNIHYHIPPHKQACYKEWNGINLPITEKNTCTEVKFTHESMFNG